MEPTIIEVGTRVELIPGREGIYKKAVAGSQGIVCEKKEDEGFPMVYVEWDKNHWRYNGEPDGWTFEAHFRPTDHTNVFKAVESPEEFSHNVYDRLSDYEGGEDEEVVEGFIDKLNEVVNLLADSDGFIVLAARSEISPDDSEESVLIPYVVSGFLSEVPMILLEAQLVQLGALAHNEMAFSILDRFKKMRGEEEE